MDDSFRYGARFALRVLVLPVHPIQVVEYEKHLTLLRQNTRIALADIPPSVTSGNGFDGINGLLAPTPTSRGHLNLDFVESWDRDEAWLEEFEIHRRIVAVVGVLDCAEWANEADGLADGAQAFQKQLHELHLDKPVFAKRCYAFSPADEQMDNAKGLVVIPNVGDPAFYIHTLLAELCSGILAGLSSTMSAIDARSHIPTPKDLVKTAALEASFSYFPAVPSSRTSTESNATNRSSSRVASPHILAPTKSPPPAPSASQNRITSISGISGSAPAMLPEAPDAKSRKKTFGRASKLRGDLYCLAGRIHEGLTSYNEAINATKTANDAVWQAAATEASILAQTYQSYQHSQPVNRTPSHTPRPSLSQLTTQPASAPDAIILQNAALGRDLPVLYNQVLELYSRPPAHRHSVILNSDGHLNAAHVATDSDETIHPLIAAEAALRCVRMQIALLFQQGVWDGTTTSRLIGFANTQWPCPSNMEIFQYTLNSPISRTVVAESLASAYEHISRLHLYPEDRIRMLSSIANVYARLYYPRKRAAILRELAAVTADAVSQRKGHEEGRESEAAANHHPTVVKSAQESAANEIVLKLMESACQAYGVSVLAPHELTKPAPEASRTVMESETALDGMDTVRNKFGWPELQAALVKDAISVSEVLPDYRGAIRFTITALKELSHALPPSDQYRLSQSIPRLFAASSRRGIRYNMAYWGPRNLVMSIEVASLPPERMPLERPIADAMQKALEETDAPAIRDAIVYNPNRLRSKLADKPVLVQSELAEFFVTLQNPFLFDLEIESIEVSTSGAACVANTLTSTIPPSSFHTIRISCTPTSPGTMVIRGCKIRVSGCDEQEFLVPLEHQTLRSAQPSQADSAIDKSDRLKRVGLGTWQSAERSFASLQSEERRSFLECTVVPSQPLLRIKDSNLTQGSTMVFEGEKSSIRFVVSNGSALSIDFLQLSFEDSHTASLQAYLTEMELPEIEVHELASDIIRRPTLARTDRTVSDLMPNKEVLLEIACLGKPGLTSANVFLDYAYVQRDTQILPATFHTRRLSLPVSISVHPSIMCTSMTLLPVGTSSPLPRRRHMRNLSVTSIGRAIAVDSVLEDSLQEMEADSHCLLVLEVLNASLRQAFEVVLESSDGSSGRIKQKVDAGASVNLLLPFSRFRLSEEQVRKPIPTLLPKQFVVGKEQTSPLEREMFWYRERLLSSLKATWREVGTRRTGAVNLRSLTLVEPMLSVLQLEELAVSSALQDVDGEELDMDDNGDFCASCGQYLQLTARIRNRSSRRLALSASIDAEHSYPQATLFDAAYTPVPTFQNVADSLESEYLSQYVIIDGNTSIPLPPIVPEMEDAGMEDTGDKQESSTDASFPLCFLAKGRFSLVLKIEERQDQCIGRPVILNSSIEHSRVVVRRIVNVSVA